MCNFMPAVGMGQQYVQFYACHWLGAAVCAILCLLSAWGSSMCNFMPAVGLGQQFVQFYACRSAVGPWPGGGGGQVPPPALKSTQEGEVYMIKLSDEREAEFFPRGRKLYDDVLTKI